MSDNKTRQHDNTQSSNKNITPSNPFEEAIFGAEEKKTTPASPQPQPTVSTPTNKPEQSSLEKSPKMPSLEEKTSSLQPKNEKNEPSFSETSSSEKPPENKSHSEEKLHNPFTQTKEQFPQSSISPSPTQKTSEPKTISPEIVAPEIITSDSFPPKENQQQQISTPHKSEKTHAVSENLIGEVLTHTHPENTQKLKDDEAANNLLDSMLHEQKKKKKSIEKKSFLYKILAFEENNPYLFFIIIAVVIFIITLLIISLFSQMNNSPSPKNEKTTELSAEEKKKEKERKEEELKKLQEQEDQKKNEEEEKKNEEDTKETSPENPIHSSTQGIHIASLLTQKDLFSFYEESISKTGYLSDFFISLFQYQKILATDIQQKLLNSTSPEQDYLEYLQRLSLANKKAQIDFESVKETFETLTQQEKDLKNQKKTSQSHLQQTFTENSVESLAESAINYHQTLEELSEVQNKKALAEIVYGGIKARIPLLQARLFAVQANKEALIQGITITPVKNSGIDFEQKTNTSSTPSFINNNTNITATPSQNETQSNNNTNITNEETPSPQETPEETSEPEANTHTNNQDIFSTITTEETSTPLLPLEQEFLTLQIDPNTKTQEEILREIQIKTTEKKSTLKYSDNSESMVENPLSKDEMQDILE